MPVSSGEKKDDKVTNSDGGMAKYGEVSRILDLIEGLETNYMDMLHMFINISRRMIENALFAQGMMNVVKGEDIDHTHIDRMTGLIGRIQEALISINNDFVRETGFLLSNPEFPDVLK
jgi:hypothetical protein